MQCELIFSYGIIYFIVYLSMEKERRKASHTYEQQMLLESFCRRDMPMFEKFSFKDRQRWVMQYLEKYRKEESWNLSRTLVIAYVAKKEKIELGVEFESDLMGECLDIVEESIQDIDAEMISERVGKFHSFLTEDDYVQVCEEYVSFVSSIDGLGTL